MKVLTSHARRPRPGGSRFPDRTRSAPTSTTDSAALSLLRHTWRKTCLASLALLISLACMATGPAAARAARGPHATAASNVTVVGRAHIARVTPRRALSMKVHGIRIRGARGAFRSRGLIVVQAVRAKSAAPRLARPAGLGLDIRFIGTRLRRPLTLAYPLRRGPRGFVPIVLHRARNGRWERRSARRTRDGHLIVRTRTFSVNLPSWVVHWAQNVRQWSSDLGHWVVSGVAGRTPPLTCGNSAPGWFSYDKRSDLIHTCSIDNADRAEIQLKSNRGITIDVRVPGNPEYVWVDDQPWQLRHLLSNVGFDAAHRVLLGPGQRMTVGYQRPSSGFDGRFLIADDTGPAFLDDMLRAALDKLVGVALDDDHQGLLLLYTEAQCAANLHLSLSDGFLKPAANAGQMLGCMIKSLPGQLDNPAALKALGLDSLSEARLKTAARAVKSVATVIEWYPFFQATAFHDIDDSLRALAKDGNDSVYVHLAGQTAAAPSSPSQPGAQDPGSQPPTQPSPDPQPQARGFHISDSFLGGTWARTDPNDGTWYSNGNRPPNGAYWYPNGLGVAVDCARRAGGYTVHWADGHTETWNVWFHVTDGKWYPSAASAETTANDTYGLPGC
jgi:hypothetical protein